MTSIGEPNGIGQCWDCGYQLRGIESRRCPECGRAFDPNNPTTTNRGRKIGRIGRWLLGRVGWPTVILAAAGALLVIWGTGWPYEFAPRFEDRSLLFYWMLGRWSPFSASGRWNAYGWGTAVVACVILWLALRIFARCLTIRRFGPPTAPSRGKGTRAVIIPLVLISVWWNAIGGARRIAREWVKDEFATSRVAGQPSYTSPPVPLSAERRAHLIRLLLLHGDDAKSRAAGIRFFLENVQDSAPLQEAALQEQDENLLTLELHLIGLYRDEDSAPFFERYLGDPRVSIRSAALDALGMIYRPAYSIGTDGDSLSSAWVHVADLPGIDVRPILQRNQEPSDHGPPVSEFPFYTRQLELPSARREILKRAMLAGATTQEREAAARALLLMPPSQYRLRVAEWGVWLDDGDALRMARSVADEIPPFVHRTGNPISEMSERIREVQIVTKPVVHLTVNEPMAVDVEVRIREGRPWFSYPKPDDFEVAVELRHRSLLQASGDQGPAPPWLLKPLDNPQLGTLPLAELGTGYPWINPSHRNSGPISGFMTTDSEIVEMGLHWQSLIVSPTQLPWMTEQKVDNDPKHDWWARLRKVNCSSLSSRGENERFLYYDGPTLMKLAPRVRLEGGVLKIDERADDGHVLEGQIMRAATHGSPGLYEDEPPDKPTGGPSRWMMLVETKQSRLRGQILAPGQSSILPFSGRTDAAEIKSAEVEQRLREMLIARGLTESETAGMLDCWREQFFAKEGLRVLTLLSPTEYDAFCPMVVRPPPTEVARVGIVLTELTDAPHP